MTWATLGRGRLSFTLLLLPAVIYVLTWRLAPALYTVWLSLTQYNIVYDAAPQLNHLENYRRIVHDSTLGEALRLSVIFAVLATAVELAIGLAAAAFFDSDPPGRNLLLGIFLLPMIMAPVVVGTVWSALFDRTVGPIPYLFELLHGPDVQWLGTPVTAMVGLIFSDAWEWAPLAALLLFSAMQAIPREQHDAARSDGASSWQLFFRVVLPQITGMLVVAGGLRRMRWRRRWSWPHILGTAMVLVWTLPAFFYLALLSVKPERIMVERSALIFWPTFERYRDIVVSDLGLPIWNSLLTSTVGALFTLALASLAAVTFTFLDFRGKALLFLLMLLPRMFPPVTTLIPIQLAMKTLGLIDTRAALIILFTGFQIPLAIWIMRTYLDEIPRELAESAAIDGASLPSIVARIVLPLAGPGLLAAFILAFIFNWNEFLFPLIVTSFHAKTGSVAIMNFAGGYKKLQWGSLAVLGVVMSMPVILFVLAFRSALIRGFTAGALKG